MKHNFTSLYFTAIFAFIFATSSAQTTGDYRSVNAPKSGAGGLWSDITKWERYDGSSWVTATAYPTSADGVITISQNDSIRVDVPITVDQVVIATNAILALNYTVNNTLTLNNGAGDDLVVNGTLLLRSFNTITGGGNIIVNGFFNWYSGILDAVTTTAVGSVTTLDLDFAKELQNDLTNNGTFNWIRGTTSGGIFFSDAVFTNNGTINEAFLANGGFDNTAGINSFINNGVFNKTTAFTFFNTNVPFTNTGTLKGIGTFSLTGTVINSGVTAPGNSPGILSATPSLLQAQAASLNIEVLDGTGAGTGHDRLDLSGDVNLATLTLNISENITAPLQAYTILTTSGTFTGTFAAVNKPSVYTISYNPTSVVITKTSSSLPALWGDFSAIAKGNVINLRWKTLQEINTSVFIVEHSTDGKNFKQVGIVLAKENTFSENNYTFTHTTPYLNGSNYYRLTLTDRDGSKSFSSVRTVKFADSKLKLLITVPNPVLNTIYLSAQKKMEIRLTDLNGKVVAKRLLSEGNNQIDVMGLSAGLYILDAYINGEKVDSQKIIKQ